jgi:NADPH:quinone reductase-like Zn-dependent oxidoreductase
MLWTARFGNVRAIYSATGLRSVQERLVNLGFLAELIEDGRLRPVTDRCYRLDEMAQAHAFVDQGHKSGDVVVTL